MIVVEPSPIRKNGPGLSIRRLQNSAVGWYWMLNGLRLALGVILLPLVLRKLSTADLGMYYVLLSLAAIVPLVDFGFGPTISRFVSYAMGGAKVLQAQGMAEPAGTALPNYHLLWELLFTTRTLYRYLAFALLFVLGAWGTYVVELRIHETASVMLTRLAWAVTLVSAIWDIYSNWWEIFLRGLNEVATAARIAVLATAVRLVLAAVLLLIGWGLLSLPVASLVGSLIQRQLARSRCLRLLARHPKPERVDVKGNLRLMWPNAWRFGVQCVSGYLTVNANMMICVKVLHLGGNARYGLSVQLFNIASGMAAVWVAVKWPVLAQLHAKHDFSAIRHVLRQRLWLQMLTLVGMGAFLLIFTTPLLQKFASNKQVLPPLWFGLLGLSAFLDLQTSTWGTVILLGNRMPFLWASLVTNSLSLVLSIALIHFTSLGLGALVLGPLLATSVFNCWYWPRYGARTIGTTVLRVLTTAAPMGTER